MLCVCVSMHVHQHSLSLRSLLSSRTHLHTLHQCLMHACTLLAHTHTIRELDQRQARATGTAAPPVPLPSATTTFPEDLEEDVFKPYWARSLGRGMNAGDKGSSGDEVCVCLSHRQIACAPHTPLLTALLTPTPTLPQASPSPPH